MLTALSENDIAMIQNETQETIKSNDIMWTIESLMYQGRYMTLLSGCMERE